MKCPKCKTEMGIEIITEILLDNNFPIKEKLYRWTCTECENKRYPVYTTGKPICIDV